MHYKFFEIESIATTELRIWKEEKNDIFFLGETTDIKLRKSRICLTF